MSGLASSPNKFSQRLSARTDLSPMRLSPPASQYIHQLDVPLTQKQHTTTLTMWQERLRRQEENADSIIEALKGQISLLRKQLETTSVSHNHDLESLQKSHESQNQQLEIRIFTLENQLKQENSLRIECERELEELKKAVITAKSEVNAMKNSRNMSFQGDMKRLIDRNREIIEENERLKADFEELRREIEVKNHAISDLRDTINLLKEENSLESLEKAEEMQQVKSDFISLQKALKEQKLEYEKVNKLQKKWEGEWKDWVLEQGLRENEVNRLRKENRELSAQVSRLEKLVYGRGTNSPVRSRTPV